MLRRKELALKLKSFKARYYSTLLKNVYSLGTELDSLQNDSTIPTSKGNIVPFVSDIQKQLVKCWSLSSRQNNSVGGYFM